MLAKYIVPFNIAIELKNAGFNEPCLAKWSKLYFNAQKPITNGDFEFQNIDLTKNECTAPLYEQVLNWILSKGLQLQPYLIAGRLIALDKTTKPYWGCNILSARTSKILWPKLLVSKVKNLHSDKSQAYNQAFLEALKLLELQIIQTAPYGEVKNEMQYGNY